ncbi:hypothetical protein [Opitutus sp. ER46]|uniref:hypothetical protein n=1 Tax=Opitutus sp. ER46 TaxID=2161864 RepID=UPI0011B29A08|nr:hypothetical protein [Opitutus sp. ER46]
MNAVRWMSPVLGQILRDEWKFAAGVVLLLTGAYLQIRLGDRIMRAEEEVKDRRLTEDVAKARLRWRKLAGPVVMLLGAVDFALLFWD